MTKNEQGKAGKTITAKLNLIDLAGSERTDSAGTTGQMLKEGNAINLSLTALGGCIKALSENKKPNFRDSKLTLLLQASMTSGKVCVVPHRGQLSERDRGGSPLLPVVVMGILSETTLLALSF